MFLDEAIVEFASGKGGDGAVSFHREKFVPRGGPDGADGGRGGDIILIADRAKRTLYDFKFKSSHRAQDGTIARSNKNGKDGESIEIRVPVGTVVSDAESGAILADLNLDGMRFVLCKGGRGGFGNLHYTSSVRQAPNFAQKGEPGEEIKAKLELKLLADFGLVGLPNAGKSTLISRISAAKPKIADYPFTTIVPNLGVVSVADTSFVVADLPGLIEGASEGIGLGHQFLKHAERTAALIHLVEVDPKDGSDPIENYHMIESELKRYSQELYERPRIVVFSKVDETIPEMIADLQARIEKETGRAALPISAITGEGLDTLLYQLVEVLRSEAAKPVVPRIILSPETKDESGFWDVLQVDENTFEIVGRRIDRLIAMTDLENDDAVRFLHRKFERIGIIEKLRELGVKDGDDVIAGDFVLQYQEDR